MPRLGNYCVTFLGDAALANAAPTADASATSSDSQHTVDQLTDADAATYWASSADSPVDVQLDFGSVTQIKAVEIDWEQFENKENFTRAMQESGQFMKDRCVITNLYSCYHMGA